MFNSDLPLFRNELVKSIDAYKTPGMPGQMGRGRQPNEVVQDFGRAVWGKMLAEAKKASVSSKTLTTNPIRHVLDKMLFNYRNIGFIHLVYPQTPILHMVRDPLDNMFSAYRKKFDDSNMEWTLDEEHIVAHYVAYLQVMAHFRATLPGRVIDIRYEELVNFPDKVMQRLTKQIGVEYSASLLEVEKSKRVIHTHSRMQMQQGVHNGSIGTWTRYSKHLSRLRREWKKQVETLRSEGILPFADRMNWDGEVDFDYGKEIYEYHYSTSGGSNDDDDNKDEGDDNDDNDDQDETIDDASGREEEEEEDGEYDDDDEDEEEYEYLVEVIDDDGTVVTNENDLFVSVGEDGGYIIEDSKGEQPFEVVEVVEHDGKSNEGSRNNGTSEVSSVSTPPSAAPSATIATTTATITDNFRSLIEKRGTPSLLHKHTSLLSFLGLSSEIDDNAMQRDCVLHGSTNRRHIGGDIFDIHSKYEDVTISLEGDEEEMEKEREWLEGASQSDMQAYIHKTLKKSEKAYQTLKNAVKGAQKASGGDLLKEARTVMQRVAEADREITKQRSVLGRDGKDKSSPNTKNDKGQKGTVDKAKKESHRGNIREPLAYTPSQVDALYSTILDKHLPLSVADAGLLVSTLGMQPSSASLPINIDQLPTKVRDKYIRTISTLQKQYSKRPLSTFIERTKFVREVFNMATILVNNGYHAYAVALAEVLLSVHREKIVTDGNSMDDEEDSETMSLAASHLDIMKLVGTAYAMQGQYEECHRILHSLLLQDEAINPAVIFSSSSDDRVSAEELIKMNIDLDLIGRLAEVAHALDRKEETLQLSDFTLVYCDALRNMSSIPASAALNKRDRASECGFNGLIATIVRKASLLTHSRQIESAAQFIDTQRQKWSMDSLSAEDSRIDDELKHYLSRLYHLSGKRHSDYGEWQQGIAQQDLALTYNPSNTDAMLDKAICLLTLSHYQQALDLIGRVLQIQPEMKIAYGYRGLLYQNLGKCALALKDLEIVLAADPKDKSCLLLAGSCYHSQGNYSAALNSYNRLLQIDADHSVIYRREILLHEVVMLDTPYKDYHPDAQLSADIKKGVSYGGQNGANFKKENVFATDEDDDDDDDVDSDGADSNDKMFYYTSEAFRRGIVDKNGDMTTSAAHQYDIDTISPPGSRVKGRGSKSKISKEEKDKLDRIEQVLQQYKHVAAFVQLAEPGFLPHDKAHKQFILSTVAMAQTLQSHIEMLTEKLEDEDKDVLLRNDKGGFSDGDVLSIMQQLKGSGLLVPDVSASSTRSFAFTPKDNEQHAFYWRDYFDLAQRWRFVAEPFDGVFWADGLDLPTEFKNRVGLSTNLISGLNKVVRYYPQLKKTLHITKELVINNGYYDGNDAFIATSEYNRTGIDVSKVRKAETIEELFVAMRAKNFIVVSDVQRKEGDDDDDGDDEALPGIVFALIKSREYQSGWEYGINIPNTLPRFRQYEREVHFAFERMTASLLRYAIQDDDDDSSDDDNAHQVLLSALELFYFWANFGALTRGTSATGYAIITSTMLSIGYDVEKHLPQGMQLDWEAFYAIDAVTYSTEIIRYLKIKRAEQRVEAGEKVMELFENMRMVRRAFVLER